MPGDVLIARREGRREAVPGVVASREDDAPRSRGVAPPAARPAGAPHSALARQARRDGRRSRARARARGLSDALALGPARRRSRSSSSSPPSGYNRLVRLRNEADTGWANIDVQLQRRTDLIPNLVEAVRGYAAHERGVFEEVTKARAALQQASTPGAAGDANDVLTAALGRLFAVAEAYPDLKASENFLRLQEDLTDTEDKISAARRYYNSTVMHFNTAIQSIPWVLVARPLGFRAQGVLLGGRRHVGAAGRRSHPRRDAAAADPAKPAAQQHRRRRLRAPAPRPRRAGRPRLRRLARRRRARRRARLRRLRDPPLAQHDLGHHARPAPGRRRAASAPPARRERLDRSRAARHPRAARRRRRRARTRSPSASGRRRATSA